MIREKYISFTSGTVSKKKRERERKRNLLVKQITRMIRFCVIIRINLFPIFLDIPVKNNYNFAKKMKRYGSQGATRFENRSDSARVFRSVASPGGKVRFVPDENRGVDDRASASGGDAMQRPITYAAARHARNSAGDVRGSTARLCTPDCVVLWRQRLSAPCLHALNATLRISDERANCFTGRYRAITLALPPSPSPPRANIRPALDAIPQSACRRAPETVPRMALSHVRR